MIITINTPISNYKVFIDNKTNNYNGEIMDNKFLIGIITIVAIIVLCSTVSSFDLFDNDNSDDNSDDNITLIKNETSGYASVTEGEDPNYYYYVDGVLKNLPNNLQGYDLKTIFYAENGTFLHEDEGNIRYIAVDSAKSEQSTIGYWCTQDPVNISYVEIIIINPDGEIVFNQTMNYDMEKFDYSRLNHPYSPSSSSDSTSSSSGSDSANVNYDINSDGKTAHYSVEGEVDGKKYNYEADYNYN